MTHAAFGRFAKYVYTAVLAVSLIAIPGAHSGYGDKISGSILKDIASTGRLQITKAQVLTDNDRAFESKLDAVRNAKKDGSIDLIYYIFADDFSSSKFTQEIIKAATERNVKVRILTDYLTNLTRADLFLALESASENISVKLYNKPTKNIKRDAVFLTSACDDNYEKCSDRKRLAADALAKTGNGTDFMSRLFLTGLYSKTLDLLKVSVLAGQKFDPALLEASAETSPEDVAKLKELGKLIYRAKVKGEFSAKIKLYLAFQMYGEEISPIYNMITGTLPLELGSDSSKDWSYLTDYTHHKFLLVDGIRFQLGGRNIEDSYHVKTNDIYQGEDKKYIFMDTDFAADVSEASGAVLTKSFDRLWDFDSMTSSMAEVQTVTELDAIARPDLAAMAVMSCKDDPKLSLCAQNKFGILKAENAKPRSIRIAEKLASITTKADEFDRLHRSDLATRDRINDQDGLLSAADLQNSQIYYIENLPFTRASWKKRERDSNSKLTRQYGASIANNEKASNKNMHELLIRGLLQTCVDSKREKKNKTVVLHNAYFFPSPNIIRTFGEMMTNSRKDCSRVTVKIITNSYQTTDLFPVNAFASAQLKAIFDVQDMVQNGRKNRRVKSKAAKFEYYEYQAGSPNDPRSLHSKVSVLGNDIIIGSANMDMRSYAMDTNNGVYIRNAKDLVADYNVYIENLIAGKIEGLKLVNRTAELESNDVNKDQFIEQQLQIIKYAIGQMSPKGKAMFMDEAFPGETPAQFKTRQDRRATLKTITVDILNLLYDSTQAGMLPANSSESKRKRNRLEKSVLDLLSTI